MGAWLDPACAREQEQQPPELAAEAEEALQPGASQLPGCSPVGCWCEPGCASVRSDWGLAANLGVSVCAMTGVS